MHARTRRPPPPWERRTYARRHPTGRTTRRWPRAYDGGAPAAPSPYIRTRYARAYDGGGPDGHRRQPIFLQRLQQSPIRNGLIGLAIAGSAAPLAVSRYQDALRIDPSHERMLTRSYNRPIDDATLNRAWHSLEARRLAARESAIDRIMEKYQEYNISRRLAGEIYDAAREHGIDPEIAFGLVRAESSFRTSATSPVGAVGLTQLMPRTARWIEPGTDRQELRDPETNLRIGFTYLRRLMEKYDGDTRLALLAYNRGPGTVDRALERGADPDNGYADFVLGKANHGHQLFTE